MTDEADIEEMFLGLGRVIIRRMFGGKGVYHQGLIIAVELRDGLLLKADAVSAPAFEAAGANQWIYPGRGGKPVRMPYWSVPHEALDDSDVMTRWARLAFEAALRGQSANRTQGAGTTPTSTRRRVTSAPPSG